MATFSAGFLSVWSFLWHALGGRLRFFVAAQQGVLGVKLFGTVPEMLSEMLLFFFEFYCCDSLRDFFLRERSSSVPKNGLV